VTTVVCVFVNGHVAYTPDYVTRLYSMVARWMDRPFRFVCLTDQPWQFQPPIETRLVPTPHRKVKGWWSKLRIFDAASGLTGRVLYLDLDTLVVAPLAPILDFPAPFALIPHMGRFEGADGRQVVKRFNSSVMVFEANSLHALWRHWSPSVMARLWGDQDWIGEQMPHAATMPLAWFPRISQLSGLPPFPQAKVILVKTPKNVQAAQTWGWFREAWA
jgi:hypothetical protein